MAIMAQIKDRGNPDNPLGTATDGNDCDRKAMIETWGKVPEYFGRGRSTSQLVEGGQITLYHECRLFQTVRRTESPL